MGYRKGKTSEQKGKEEEAVKKGGEREHKRVKGELKEKTKKS